MGAPRAELERKKSPSAPLFHCLEIRQYGPFLHSLLEDAEVARFPYEFAVAAAIFAPYEYIS